MSQKHSNARAKGAAPASHGPSALVKQTPIFVTCSQTYRPVYELFLQSVRQCKLDEAQIKALLYEFHDLPQQASTGYRTAPWYQAQRQKFGYFRDQLAQLPEGQPAMFVDADVQFFPNLQVLEDVLQSMRTRGLDMMFIAEHGGPTVNPGFILAVNTPRSRTLFERMTTTLGDYGRALHPATTIIAEGEPEQVINRLLQRTPPDDLKWSMVPPVHIALGPDTQNTRWNRVFLHHAICASGGSAKVEQMGRVRHIYFNWKYAEATNFPTVESQDPLVSMPRVQGGVWVAKANGKLHARDDGGIETRNPSVVKLLGAVHEKYSDIPDFSPIYICTQDTPSARVPGMRILAFSTDKRQPRTQLGQQVIAVPDNVFDHWRNAGMPDYEDTCAQIRAAAQRGPQKNVAGWIGNAQMHQTRLRLLEMAHHHPAELEAINTGIWKQVPNLPRFEVGQGRYYSLPEQVEMYAYLLDVEGNGWSGRLKLLFHSGRPLLIQERPWEEFYFPQIKAFEHYVPVAADMSDLIKQVQWLQGHPEEGDRIASNAQAFAKEHLSRAAALDAWARILRAL